MKKRHVSTALMGMGMTVLLAGCGSGSGSTSPQNLVDYSEVSAADREFDLEIPGFPLSEPISVSVMGPNVGIMEWEDIPFWKAITEATNIHFTFTTPPQLDFTTNLNLAFASQNVSDVIYGASLTPEVQIEQGAAGLLIPLQDLIAEHAPNITKILDEHPDIRNSITAPDGNIYSLPTINLGVKSLWPHGPLYYNGQWLEALNADVPTTLDDFTALMERFRDEMPGILGVDRVYPISATDKMEYLRNWIISFWGMTAREIEVVDGVVRYNPTTDNYRAYIEWMNMAFNNGLLHPEIFTLANDQQDALGKQNMIGVFQTWHSHWFLDTPEEQGMHNPMLRAISSAYSPNGVLPRSPGFQVGGLSITRDAQNPEAIMQLVDWFYTEEGAVFTDLGPEGHLWVWEEHISGEPIRVFEPSVDPDDGYSRGRVTPAYGFPAPGILPEDAPVVYRYTDEPLISDFEYFLRQETEETMGQYGKVAMPPLMLTAEEANSVSLIMADLIIELNMQEASFVTGIKEINDDTWAELQNTLKNIGVEKLVDVYQTAYDRWASASK